MNTSSASAYYILFFQQASVRAMGVNLILD